jgi:hypothetical protein
MVLLTPTAILVSLPRSTAATSALDQPGSRSASKRVEPPVWVAPASHIAQTRQVAAPESVGHQRGLGR